jgi:hypothetical protein
MNKFDIEPTGMFKMMGNFVLTVWRMFFGPWPKVGETWYTSYHDHLPTRVIEIKGPWVYYEWPGGKSRRKFLWDFITCYCRREDIE